MSLITYDLSWWLWPPLPAIIPWVHGPLSSCWTATADPMGIFENNCDVSLSFFLCLSTSLAWWSSSWSCPIGFWINYRHNASIDRHSGISVVVCMMSTQSSMPFISWSFPSAWLCLDSQSVIKISGPGLYVTWTLYWCIFSRIHWILCDNVATSFLNIDTSSLWSVIICTSLPKQ